MKWKIKILSLQVFWPKMLCTFKPKSDGSDKNWGSLFNLKKKVGRRTARHPISSLCQQKFCIGITWYADLHEHIPKKNTSRFHCTDRTLCLALWSQPNTRMLVTLCICLKQYFDIDVVFILSIVNGAPMLTVLSSLEALNAVKWTGWYASSDDWLCSILIDLPVPMCSLLTWWGHFELMSSQKSDYQWPSREMYLIVRCKLFKGFVFAETLALNRHQAISDNVADMTKLFGINILRTRQNSLMKFWNAFSWMKIYKFRSRFQRSLFPRVQLTIFQLCFR